MSNREMAIDLLNQIPEYKLKQVIFFLQGAAIPDEIPNAETISAIEELENGGGDSFAGSTDDFLKEMVG